MIYFDNAATTKPSSSALDRAKVFNEDIFFNPSALYAGGLMCAKEIKNAKDSVLKNLGAVNHEVIFTSCGTESDNTAIFGSVRRGTFVTDEGEHSAVYKSFSELKNRGNNVCFIPLKKYGAVDENILYNYVENNKTDFVSIVHVNNETGAINDINSIAARLKKINPALIFHADGVQAYGKIPYRISADIDLYSISSHKINGLKGTGALIRKKNVSISPIIIGGGQENDKRSGTENVFGIKVFEYAGEEHYNKLNENFVKAEQVKNAIINLLDKDIFHIISGENSSPYILSVSAKGLRGEVIMHSLEEYGIIVGNGSACSSKNRYSRVIQACGYKKDVLDGVIRLSFDFSNTVDEAVFVAEKLNEVSRRLKGII